MYVYKEIRQKKNGATFLQTNESKEKKRKEIKVFYV